MSEVRERAELGRFIEEHETVVLAALRTYIAEMEEATAEARRYYEAGQSDPVVKAEQDKSLVTNAGYRQSAELFTDAVRRARRAIEGIMLLLNLGDEEE